MIFAKKMKHTMPSTIRLWFSKMKQLFFWYEKSCFVVNGCCAESLKGEAKNELSK